MTRIDDILATENPACSMVNSAGDQAVETVMALQRIGAHRAAALVQQANAVFGPAGPAKDRTERGDQVALLGAPAEERWSELDSQFYQYPDNLTALLREYVTIHRSGIRA